LLFDFAVLGIIFLLGLLFDGIENFSNYNTFKAVILTAIYAIPSAFIKNIFEEFGWRGYLVPRLFEKNNNVRKHLFISIIWACWHLPYWLFFFNREQLLLYTPYGIIVTIIINFIALFFLAIIYNTIRLITKSIWPAIIIHTMNNVLVIAYYQNIQYNTRTEWLFAPAYGILYIISIGIVSILMLRMKPLD